MARDLVIVKHIPREGPGPLETELKACGIGYTVAELHQERRFPLLGDHGAVVVLGGSHRANDENEKMEIELTGIRKAIASNIPYLGICLGLQTLVKATGGDVMNSPTNLDK